MKTNEMGLHIEKVSGKRIGFKLKNINLVVPEGHITGLMGKNGAGKTTLIHYIMNGNYNGSIFFNGDNIKDDYSGFLKNVGYISESRKLFNERTAYDNGRLLGYLNERFDVEAYEKELDRFHIPKNRFYQNLSRAEKIKWQLAFAISCHPKLYIMDEPTAGMDAVFRREFYDVLSELILDGKTSVLLTSHIEEDMRRRADFVAVLDNGELLQYDKATVVLGETVERTVDV